MRYYSLSKWKTKKLKRVFTWDVEGNLYWSSGKVYSLTQSVYEWANKRKTTERAWTLFRKISSCLIGFSQLLICQYSGSVATVNGIGYAYALYVEKFDHVCVCAGVEISYECIFRCLPGKIIQKRLRSFKRDVCVYEGTNRLTFNHNFEASCHKPSINKRMWVGEWVNVCLVLRKLDVK